MSTALMYAFAQRSDTRVVDEPLYGHYLRVSGADHPGAKEVMTNTNCNGHQVVRDVILGDCDQPVCFMKQMAHHLVEIDRSFLRETTNILLIRNPVDMLPSLSNQLDCPTLRDTGLKTQEELFQELIEMGQDPPVLDSRELLQDPASVLERLCEKIGIEFQQAMLNWPAGPRAEDGIWADHWYHNLHKSTGFEPYRPKTTPFPERLKPLLDVCSLHYQNVFQHAIRATTD